MSDSRKMAGRASSQISIYDYPEHLNPFYEDENHKRLRFWKIGSSSKNGGQKLGRSNSFTLSGLKDIWAFKSFKLKKKSSTLGINKTSESPPELRRVYPVADTYNTVDSRSRHTVDIGLGNGFQRNAGYRSSLQNVHSTGGFQEPNGFYRNDRYRSTIQNGFQTLATTSPQRDRYVYSGSVTPTPRTRYVTPQSMTHGSSQTSINSTNPFEEDDAISRCESIDGVSPRRHGRKKRKAPQPPVTCPAVSTHQQACTTVEENPTSEGKDDMAEISHLTAEIETFVRTHDTDREKLRESPEKSVTRKKEKSPPIPTSSTLTQAQTVHIKTEDVNEKKIETRSQIETRNTDLVVSSQQAVAEVSPKKDTLEEVPSKTEVVIEVHKEQFVDESVSTDAVGASVSENRSRIAENPSPEHRSYGSSRESPENNEDYPERSSQTPDPEYATTVRKFSSVKQLNLCEENDELKEPSENVAQSPPRIIIRKPTEDWEFDEELRLNDEVQQSAQCAESPKTPISSEVEFILEHDKMSQSTPLSSTSSQAKEIAAVPADRTSISKEKPKISPKKNFKNSLENFSAEPEKGPEPNLSSVEPSVPELKIVESTDDLTSSPPPISQNSERFKIRFIALKNFSPEPERREVELRSHNSQDDDIEDVDLPPAPPQRRRSVRDIIASINKSQSLLKINNQQPVSDGKRFYSTEVISQSTIPTTISAMSNGGHSNLKLNASNESIVKKFNELDESEKKIRKMISEMERSSVDVPVPVVERFEEIVSSSANAGENSEDLFKKCVVRRDKSSSSGASQDNNRPSMEWNPVPKPRRSRNLTQEMEAGKI